MSPSNSSLSPASELVYLIEGSVDSTRFQRNLEVSATGLICRGQKLAPIIPASSSRLATNPFIFLPSA